MLGQVLTLLGELEDTALNKPGAADDRTVWGISDIRLGSVVATFTPNMPKRGATTETLTNVMNGAVRGFAEAEEHEGLPKGWNSRSAKTAAEMARLLGLMASQGMKVEVLDNQTVVRSVTVTRRAAENLNATLKVRRESIGSVIGLLDAVTIHERREAGLWHEATSQRVPVTFNQEHLEQVREAFGKRVEISGLLVRDFDDRLVRVRMRELETLPTASESPATGLVGLSPDMIGDASPEKHLEELRGAS